MRQPPSQGPLPPLEQEVGEKGDLIHSIEGMAEELIEPSSEKLDI